MTVLAAAAVSAETAGWLVKTTGLDCNYRGRGELRHTRARLDAQQGAGPPLRRSAGPSRAIKRG